MKIYDFKINNVEDSLNIPVSKLSFSWKLDSDKDNLFQKSYRLTVKNDATVFDSGVVESEESLCVTFKNMKLEYKTEYEFELSVTLTNGDSSCISKKFFTELGDFGVKAFIKPAKSIEGASYYLRKKFELKENIKSAKLWGTCLGCGEFTINGKKVGNALIDPPQTNYEKIILYRTYDVTDFLKSGGNCIAAQLGEGFYAQRRVWGGMVYGDECMIARLEIEYEDGTKDVVVSDTSWKAKMSPIIENNVYGGEVYDARFETPDFALFEGSDDGWIETLYDETPKGKLTPCLMPETTIIREIPCVSVKPVSGKADGAWVFDLGENFAGIYEFKMKNSHPGHVYTFRCAEVLGPDGNIDVRSIGAMATQVIQQEVYISNGKPDQVFRPKFCYHGFRYVEMTGMEDTSEGYGTMPKADFIVGLQTSTNMKRIGSFTCDNEDLSKLCGIMDNTFRSNYHGIPEDCPAREKCGWLGDAEVICNWALYNYDILAPYHKYLDDMRTSREIYGTWQMIAPGKRTCGSAAPLWGAAQILLPYNMWKMHGDKTAVLENIDLMRLWVENELKRSKDYVIEEGLGDWDPPSTPERKMPVPHSSTLMFYEICDKMAEISRAFGFGDEEKYTALKEAIKESFIRHFYDKESHGYGFWGTNGAALLLGIYPDGEKNNLLNATVSQIEAEDFEMPTGIYGNKYLVPALCENGRSDVAFTYLFTRKHYSYGTMMDDNATTIWEVLNMHHVEPDRETIVSSYNHPMHGGFLYFCFSHIAGIKPVEPGFKKFRIEPCNIPEINEFECSFDSPYGIISVSKKNGELKVKAPCNTQYEII